MQNLFLKTNSMTHRDLKFTNIFNDRFPLVLTLEIDNVGEKRGIRKHILAFKLKKNEIKEQ